ncbi:hypothetical protein K501DRAFT_174078 [Backusella circina FSU 941]|nr:hypothetical protein K501DRAFT_174078 [Backusella circina FSU 941]
MKTLGFLCLASLIVLAKPAEAACGGEAIINNQGDLDKIASCQTFSGTIKIDNTGATELRLPGVEVVQGDLVVSNNNGLQKLYLPSLQAVNGGFMLNNNKLLAVLDMPKLQACHTFDIMVHPALKAIKFPANLSQLQKLNVADTTTTVIEGLTAAQPREIEIKHNIYLKQLQFNSLVTVERIKIFANSPALTVDVSKLEEIVSGEFRNLAGVALFKLRKVNGDISFIANTFPNLDLPAINDIIGTLNIADNTNLYNLTMHKLEHLGGALAIGGNTKLQSIRSFPELQGIEGSVDIYGEFDEVFFPVLNDVSLVIYL